MLIISFCCLEKTESSATTSAEYQPSKKPRLSAESEDPSPSSSPKSKDEKKEDLCDALLMPTSLSSPARLAEIIRKSATTLVSLLQGNS